MLPIAIVGAGRIGKIHARNAAAHPSLTLKYVVDYMPDAAAELATAVGAIAATFDEVIHDEEIAGIVIASSTDTHLDYSVRAVNAGKAVFCEKPLDLDLEKARAAASSFATAPFLLGFNRRFDPNFARLKAQLVFREMGEVETLHIISHDPAPPPIEYVKVSGGLFADMAIHDFDMARWLLGEEPVEVYAAGECLVDPAIGDAGDIDTAKTILRTATGRICLISNSRRSGYGYDQRIEAFCSGGVVRANNLLETSVERWTERGTASEPLQNFFLDRYAQAYVAEMQHFADMLNRGQSPLVGYADGVKALTIADAALASHRAGRLVRLAG